MAERILLIPSASDLPLCQWTLEVPPRNFCDAISNITLSGYDSIGAGGLTNNANNVFEWKDDLTHITATTL